MSLLSLVVVTAVATNSKHAMYSFQFEYYVSGDCLFCFLFNFFWTLSEARLIHNDDCLIEKYLYSIKNTSRFARAKWNHISHQFIMWSDLIWTGNLSCVCAVANTTVCRTCHVLCAHLINCHIALNLLSPNHNKINILF